MILLQKQDLMLLQFGILLILEEEFEHCFLFQMIIYLLVQSKILKYLFIFKLFKPSFHFKFWDAATGKQSLVFPTISNSVVAQSNADLDYCYFLLGRRRIACMEDKDLLLLDY